MSEHISSDLADEIPVVIAGAGPVGLTLSILLSKQKIPNIVLEKRERINTLPRARGINVRSVEILTQLDLGEALRKGSLPPEWARQFVYTETMAGELVGTMPGTMAAGMMADFSPCEYRIAAQDRLDPMLYAKACTFDEATICFNEEVIRYHEADDSIIVSVLSKSSTELGQVRKIKAKYLIAADGGKSSLRSLAGIDDAYSSTYRSFVAAHFIGDLSAYTGGREGALIWTLAPGVEGVFHPLDGNLKWSAQIQYNPSIEDPDQWTPEDVIQKIRAMIGISPDVRLDIDLVKYYKLELTDAVADRFRDGRLILAGDSAHRTLPHGGWGLNTGIHSAHNLAWKLSTVLHGWAPPELLDTYNNERREAALRNCEFAKINASYIEKMMRSVRQSSNLEERRRILLGSKQYGNWAGLDLGIHYEGSEGRGAFVADDVLPPIVSDPVIDYRPHAKPGWRAPHFWIRTAADGYRISILNLFESQFVLLTGEDGQPWIDALNCRKMEPLVQGYRVSRNGDVIPESTEFCELYGISSSGAVLIRPDGHVAWRIPHATDNPLQDITDAIDQVLCRSRSVVRHENM